MIRRAALVLVLLAGTVVALPAASAAAATRPDGRVWSAVQNDAAHTLRVGGWAFDPSSSRSSVVVKFYDGRTFIGKVVADRPSPTVNRRYHVGGRHDFLATFHWAHPLRFVTARTPGVHRGHRVTVDVQAVRHLSATPAARVIAVARYYVGRARYVYGGTTPRPGFDCSGYTAWVYAHSGARHLPRTAEQQRRSVRLIPAWQARPGDLVFYSVPAFHVAIYAGNHMQYSAATVRDGIRYQAIWSSHVQYGTVLH